MSWPVWLTFSKSKTLISSVANGFRCLALARGMIERAGKVEAPWLDGGVWNEVDGEVEMFSVTGFVCLIYAAIVQSFAAVFDLGQLNKLKNQKQMF